MLALSFAVIVLGVPGVIGVVTPEPILVAVLLDITVILSYDAVEQPTVTDAKYPSPFPTNPIHPTLFSMDR